MYLDRELQIILSVPVSGVAEEIIIEHTPGTGETIINWIAKEGLDAAASQLPQNLISVVINQRDLMRLLNHDDIIGAAIDTGATTVLFQARRDLFEAAGTAQSVAKQISE